MKKIAGKIERGFGILCLCFLAYLIFMEWKHRSEKAEAIEIVKHSSILGNGTYGDLTKMFGGEDLRWESERITKGGVYEVSCITYDGKSWSWRVDIDKELVTRK